MAQKSINEDQLAQVRFACARADVTSYAVVSTVMHDPAGQAFVMVQGTVNGRSNTRFRVNIEGA